jgi:hypothetical protein
MLAWGAAVGAMVALLPPALLLLLLADGGRPSEGLPAPDPMGPGPDRSGQRGAT